MSQYYILVYELFVDVIIIYMIFIAWQAKLKQSLHPICPTLFYKQLH